jgi:hypothetical protein
MLNPGDDSPEGGAKTTNNGVVIVTYQPAEPTARKTT